ncbi:DUF349 domain-containing protein [soil metagenome]
MSTDEANPWGRIDADGNVYVRTTDGERIIAQWLGGEPEEALALYTRKFEGLEAEVGLLEKRLEGGALSPDDAVKTIATTRASITGAQAIGDLDALTARLDALDPILEKQREARKAARAERSVKSLAAKEKIAVEAEKIAAGSDWRVGADRLRELLDEWKALPHLDKKADDTLWKRFSAARTSFTKRRKTHFSEQSVKRDAAQKSKETLVKDAEALSTSTDWGKTAGEYRDLMDLWKKAGPAPRGVEDKLWKRFRGAQDAFFAARDEANTKLDAEFEVNAEKKLEILAEAEALLPITDLDSARKAWHGIADRWEAAGKVPRAKIKEFEGRIRKVEDAIRAADDAKWKRSNPELSARADDTVSKLQKAIDDAKADLAKAEAAGNTKKVKELTASIETRELWLDQAKKTASEFS